MRKLLLVAFIGLQTAFSQNLGFNGAGFFENYDADVAKYLKELDQPFTLRVPGGAISKFHDPYNVKEGWGLTEKNVTHWFETTGFDEDGNGLEKWLRKTEEQPGHSYLDDLIALQKEFPQMHVLWVLNVLNSTTQANLEAIRYLVNNGVHITGVEAGNEVYGKYASFMEYVHDFEPIFTAIRKEFPDIKLGLVAGANLSRKELAKWNADMAQYKGAFDAVIPHYYLTARELGAAYDMIPLRSAYDPKKESKDLRRAYEKAAELLAEDKMMEEGCAYLKELFPGKEIWITEWNTKPSEMLSNTIVNGAWQFEKLVEVRKMTTYLLIHNGVGPDKYCAISKSSKYDVEPEGKMMKRMSYFALQLAGEAGDAMPLKSGEQTISGTAGSEQRFYFTNMTGTKAVNFTLPKGLDADIRIHYVAGEHIYSSAGLAGYMGKGTKKSYAVNCVMRAEYTGTLPAYSFGYIVVTLK